MAGKAELQLTASSAASAPEAFITPVGTAVLPRLDVPDTKFNSDGIYSVRLRLSLEDAKDITDRIEELARLKLEAVMAELLVGKVTSKGTAGRLKMCEDKSYRMALDEEGRETDNVELLIKMKAKTQCRETNEVLIQRPAIFDAGLQPMTTEVPEGARIKVAGEYVPFSTSLGVGVSLQLRAVQVIEIPREVQERHAGAYGFKIEKGFRQGR